MSTAIDNRPGSATPALAGFLAAFEARQRGPARDEPAWLRPIRQAAIARLAETGLPSPKDEDWRFTNLAPLTRTRFAPAEPGPELRVRDLSPWLWGGGEVIRLVFVNGRYAARLSTPGPGLTWSMAEALPAAPPALAAHLGRQARWSEHAAAAVNTALFEDGALVCVPRGQTLAQPIHLLFVTLPGSEPAAVHPRTLIVLEEAAQATVVETYAGRGPGACFVNPVTEIVAGQGAVLEHVTVQRNAPEAMHLGLLHVQQQRDANVHAHWISLGGRLVRHDIHAVLAGPGGDCHLDGLFLAGDGQHVDNHLRVEHVADHCGSREVFRGILDGDGRGVFTGRIHVHPGAQKTDAKQSNHNLLLGPAAQVDTRPQLEIFADDVKCTHGATIGRLDADALFYLRSRGLPEEAARSLLVQAFAADSLERVAPPALRAAVRREVLSRLPHSELLEDPE